MRQQQPFPIAMHARMTQASANMRAYASKHAHTHCGGGMSRSSSSCAARARLAAGETNETIDAELDTEMSVPDPCAEPAPPDAVGLHKHSLRIWRDR